jgi:hypothetical protein
MKILGAETMGADELKFELQRGGKFVICQYCISVLVITFKPTTHFRLK